MPGTSAFGGGYPYPAILVKPLLRPQSQHANLNYTRGSRLVQFQAIQVPADTWIMHAWLRVVTACAAGANGDLGYGSDTDKWGQFLKLTATGVISGQHQESSGGGIIERGVNEPFHFSSDDTIDLKLNKAATSGVVEGCVLALRSK